MARGLQMSGDGILQIVQTGDVGREDVEAFLEDFVSFLEAATEEEPLFILADTKRVGKLSVKARKTLVSLSRDSRFGRIAILGSGRYIRVMVSFVNKAVGRDNVRFFDAEDKALTWLKAGR
jgi:hypothetical protein